jgi:hypothetical protein
MTRLRVFAFGACLVTLITGCTMQVGRNFDPSRVNELRPGVSTVHDAEARFGPASLVSSNPENGHQLLQWSYVYGTSTGAGGGANLAIVFGADGRMIRIAHLITQQ